MSTEHTLLEHMKNGEFVVSVQIDPPGSHLIGPFRHMVMQLKEAGVRVVDVNSSRRISHDSIQLSAVLAHAGFEVIPHITVRDSSINGLVNQILAAYAWRNITNFLVITGDAYEAEHAIIPSSPSRGVFHTDSIGALEAFNTYIKNAELALPITFAASVNQNEENLTHEGCRVARKQKAGVDFFMSQPIFTKKQAEDLFEFYTRYSDKPLMVGVWPLINEKTLRAINSGRIVGVHLPDEIYERALEHKNTDDLHEWGLQQAHELILFLKEQKRAAGVYIVAPTKNPLLILDLIKKVL